MRGKGLHSPSCAPLLLPLLCQTLLQLENARAYVRVLELRLLEVVPDHAIPVTEGSLGLPVPSLSRLATAAAAALLSSSTASSGKITAAASQVRSRGDGEGDQQG
jgi:hypothetical protein